MCPPARALIKAVVLVLEPSASTAIRRTLLKLYRFALPQVPTIPLSGAGIVRCRRCRTYINPFVSWLDGGRRFKCNVCAMINDIPSEYYCPIDTATGKRHDHGSRPELCCGRCADLRMVMGL